MSEIAARPEAQECHAGWDRTFAEPGDCQRCGGYGRYLVVSIDAEGEQSGLAWRDCEECSRGAVAGAP
jgi:hypothetical protein